jgi:hypothetical protein
MQVNWNNTVCSKSLQNPSSPSYLDWLLSCANQNLNLAGLAIKESNYNLNFYLFDTFVLALAK